MLGWLDLPNNIVEISMPSLACVGFTKILQPCYRIAENFQVVQILQFSQTIA